MLRQTYDTVIEIKAMMRGHGLLDPGAIKYPPQDHRSD